MTMLSSVGTVNATNSPKEKKGIHATFPAQDPIKEFPPKLKENDPITRFLDQVLIQDVTLEMKALIPMWDTTRHVPVKDTKLTYTSKNAFAAQAVYSDTIIPNRLVLWDKTELTVKIYGSITYYDQRLEGEKVFREIENQLETATGLSLKLVDYQVPKTDIVIKFPDSRMSRNAPKLVTTEKEKHKTYYTNQAVIEYPKVNVHRSNYYIKKFDINKDYTFNSVLCQNKRHGDAIQVSLFIRGCMVSALGLPNIRMGSDLDFEGGINDLFQLYSGKLKPGMDTQAIKEALQ